MTRRRAQRTMLRSGAGRGCRRPRRAARTAVWVPAPLSATSVGAVAAVSCVEVVVELGDLVVGGLPAAGEVPQRALGGVVRGRRWRCDGTGRRPRRRRARGARGSGRAALRGRCRSRRRSGSRSVTGPSWRCAGRPAAAGSTRPLPLAASACRVLRRTAPPGPPTMASVGIGLAVTAPVLAVAASHLDHRHRLGGEEAGQTGTPRAGALDPDRVESDRSVRSQRQQSPIAGRGGGERFGAEQPA